MSLLTRVISQFRRSATNTKVSAPEALPDDLDSRTRITKQRIKNTSTPEDCLDCLRREVLPLLEACIWAGRVDLAAQIETLAYRHIVLATEQPGHAQACLDLIDSPLRQLAHRLGGSNGPEGAPPNDWRPVRWVFYVQNFMADLAHSNLLCELIASYLQAHPEQVANIRITGLSFGFVADCFRRLHEEYGVRLCPMLVTQELGDREMYPLLQDLAMEISRNGDERCIVVGPPIGLSFLSGCLHPERLAWLSMKFDLTSFQALSHRFSFASARRSCKRVENTVWRSAPPFFTQEPEVARSDLVLPHMEHISKFSTVFYTINREPKIRNPEFLEAVSRILLELPTACFVWTGRKELADITGWFNERGIGDRCFYVGWIDPDALLARGDIFLDTPTLSGTVAAKAVLCGIPVMTFQGARSWVNFFGERLEDDIAGSDTGHPLEGVRRLFGRGLELECATVDAYVQQAVALAQTSALRQIYGDGLRAFGRHYFLRHREYACLHFENFSSNLHDPLDSPC